VPGGDVPVVWKLMVALADVPLWIPLMVVEYAQPGFKLVSFADVAGPASVIVPQSSLGVKVWIEMFEIANFHANSTPLFIGVAVRLARVLVVFGMDALVVAGGVEPFANCGPAKVLAGGLGAPVRPALVVLAMGPCT
jgi:hypothetical protein